MRIKPPELRQKGSSIAALLLLCLIWASASLRADLLPGSIPGISIPPLVREATLLMLFAVLAGATALIRKAPWPQGKMWAIAALVGLGLFAVPVLLIQFGKEWVDDSTRVVLFSLTPVFAVLFEPYVASDSGPEQRSGFAAALVAVVGTLLVFPIELPHSVASALAFGGLLAAAASIAAANCLGVRSSQLNNGFSFAAIASGVAAVCLGVVATVFRRSAASAVPLDAWAIPDLCALVLLFWLMPRMTATKMTTRFLIAPLLANLVGLAFLRPHVQLQAWFGLLLIATASVRLLLKPSDESEVTGSSLGIS